MDPKAGPAPTSLLCWLTAQKIMVDEDEEGDHDDDHHHGDDDKIVR